MQDNTKPAEFNRDDMDAADALFALAHQDSRNVVRKITTGEPRSPAVSASSYRHPFGEGESFRISTIVCLHLRSLYFELVLAAVRLSEIRHQSRVVTVDHVRTAPQAVRYLLTLFSVT